LQDELIGALITLAKVTEFTEETEEATAAIIDGLFATVANVDFDAQDLQEKIAGVTALKDKLLVSRCVCQGKCIYVEEYSVESVFGAGLDADVRTRRVWARSLFMSQEAAGTGRWSI